ncbi:MAG: beta-galactosidase [Rhizomicrobium sp.]
MIHVNRARIAAIATLVFAFAAALSMPVHAESATAHGHTITWDSRSLKIDGARVFIWSGEFHPFRLPSPSMWRDVLQKMKAIGYNTVTYYIPWGYYTATRGVYDFTGVRDVDLALRMAEESGLYVIVRAGPYVNAELTRGGFPSWLVNQKAKARTDDPEYLAAVDEWYAHINPILARHQITNGGGTIIAYQIENELLETTPAQTRYMQHLYDRARAGGITVPIFHNDIGRNGYWVPRSSTVPGTVMGPNDLYAWDTYPGGTCRADATVGAPNAAPDWGWYGPGGARGGASASPNTPGFTAEFGGGWFDYWGSNGTYSCTAKRIGGGYERVFYGTNIANGLTLENFYMAFGGTSWGWLAGPVVYTSYDYGAGIDETRGLREKALVLKQLGEFVQTTEQTLAGMQKGPAVKASSDAIKVYHNVNPDNGAHLFVAMHSPSSVVTNDAFSFAINTADGDYLIPKTGTLRIDGQDSKLILAAYNLERQRLVYSTSQLQTHLRRRDMDIALFYGRRGEDSETVLRYASAPTVQTLSGKVAVAFDAATGSLRLNYVHNGLARVRISGGGRAPLLLLLADEQEAQSFWRQDTPAGGVLERGPALVRTASIKGVALALTGDTAAPSDLEVWAPPRVRQIIWNDGSLATQSTDSGSLVTASPLPGPNKVALPDISAGVWLRRMGSPEAARDFDDSKWKSAMLDTSASNGRPPLGQPTLTMDDYGFHHGDVWYRGHYSGDGASTRLELTYGGGGVGLLQLWIDGQFVGQNELPAGLARPQTVGTCVFEISQAARSSGDHVIAVMIRNDGHNWDLFADDAHKEGRGLIAVSLSTLSGPRYAVPIAWKIRGMGEHLTDIARGVMNNGGQYGELEGWHLPGLPETNWEHSSLSAAPPAPGTMWLRTQFDLALPANQDVQLGLAFGDTNVLRSDQHYRVLIFVNGWNMGQFIAHVGPQRVFVIPPGILNPRGHNTLALAVTTDGNPENVVEPVHLVVLRAVRGGIPVGIVPVPDFRHWSKGNS